MNKFCAEIFNGEFFPNYSISFTFSWYHPALWSMHCRRFIPSESAKFKTSTTSNDIHNCINGYRVLANKIKTSGSESQGQEEAASTHLQAYATTTVSYLRGQ